MPRIGGSQDIARFGEVFHFGTPPHYAYTNKELCTLIKCGPEYMGDIGGVANAAASNVNTLLTNQANEEMQQRANTFNAQQAGIQRQWSGQQAQNQMAFNASEAAKQRGFADTEQTKAEAWNERMSDTAIQRRSADIKSAGFNPLLAVGQLGGASTPVMGAPSGSAASAGLPSGSAASAAGAARSAPFDVAGASLALTNAQAANTRQNTLNAKDQDRILSGQADQWEVDTSPEMLFRRTQAIAAQYDMEYAKANEVNSVVESIRNAAAGSDLDNQWKQIRNTLGRMDVTQTQATLASSVAMQNAVNAQATTEARNVNDVQKGLLGKTIAYAQAVLTPVASGAGAAKSATSAIRDVAEMP